MIQEKIYITEITDGAEGEESLATVRELRNSRLSAELDRWMTLGHIDTSWIVSLALHRGQVVQEDEKGTVIGMDKTAAAQLLKSYKHKDYIYRITLTDTDTDELLDEEKKKESDVLRKHFQKRTKLFHSE